MIPPSAHSLFSGTQRRTSEALLSSESLCPCTLALAFLSGPAMHYEGPAQHTKLSPCFWHTPFFEAL